MTSIYIPDERSWSDISKSEKWYWIGAHVKRELSRCDWTQLPNSGLSISKRLEWQAYRDNLRSIQDDYPNPDDVVFPTEPTEE